MLFRSKKDNRLLITCRFRIRVLSFVQYISYRILLLSTRRLTYHTCHSATNTRAVASAAAVKYILVSASSMSGNHGILISNVETVRFVIVVCIIIAPNMFLI